MLFVLAWVSLGCAIVPALLYLWNAFLFREPPRAAGEHLSVSVLIPARNEERGIARCLGAVLSSKHVDLEVIVLDDASTDRTAEIVRSLAATDARVQIEAAPLLPDGWCGKQHACHVLSKMARFDTFAFLDADVRLEPEALCRMAAFLKESGTDLVSGFPHQETGTLFEKLLIPLIHWLLLSFLPMWGMRHFRWSAFGAGCGQLFMTTRDAYRQAGGHEAVWASLHDGITLPHAYRRAGLWTDLCDITNLASCRMYRSARGVWFGLAKNACEGMASTGQIGFWTVVLLCGQVLPFVILSVVWLMPEKEPTMLSESDFRVSSSFLGLLALAAVYAPRIAAGIRYRQSWIGVLLHPFAIVLLLMVQWYALGRAVLGKPVGWKGREAPTMS